MNETEFNASLRAVLRTQGLGGLHIREADIFGVSDLVIWRGRSLLAWAELKVDDRILEPQQHEFLMERDAESGSAYVIRYSNKTGVTQLARPVPQNKVVILATVPNYGLADWIRLFEYHRRPV